MGFSLVPNRVLECVYDLSPQSLQASGIKLVLADLDNTLAPYGQALPSPALAAWRDALAQCGIQLFVVSNSRKSRRCPDFCSALGVPYVRHAGKPGAKGFHEALSQTGLEPRQALMVGDQIFTDILGANRAGVFSVLVKPIAWGGNPLRRLRYALETPFRSLGKRRNHL